MDQQEFERNQGALEELEHDLRVAQNALNEGLTELRDAVNEYQRKADSLHPDVYDNAHPGSLDQLVKAVDGWVNGGNPYDPTLERFIDEDIHKAENALADARDDARDGDRQGFGRFSAEDLERGDREFHSDR